MLKRCTEIFFSILLFPLLFALVGGVVVFVMLLAHLPMIEGNFATRIQGAAEALGMPRWILFLPILSGAVFFTGLCENTIFPFFARVFWGKHWCEYCYQRYRTEEAATQCCLTSPPTAAWLRRHHLSPRWFLVRGSITWMSGYVGLLLIVGQPIFTWWTLLLLAFLLGPFIQNVYRPYTRQKPCSVCGVNADWGGDPSLCSRCYAQRITNQARHDGENS